MLSWADLIFRSSSIYGGELLTGLLEAWFRLIAEIHVCMEGEKMSCVCVLSIYDMMCHSSLTETMYDSARDFQQQ